ncbi:MAG TPA: hypothetical protein VFU86_10745, partial [Terriglobales bacterium]|nr:hypothetical protein [Terriglobales bacterium]
MSRVSDERIDELICLHGRSMEQFLDGTDGSRAFADTILALGELRELREANNWKLISEETPVGQERLLHKEEDGTDVYSIGYFNRLTRTWFYDGLECVEDLGFTRWRPLPASPGA